MVIMHPNEVARLENRCDACCECLVCLLIMLIMRIGTRVLRSDVLPEQVMEQGPEGLFAISIVVAVCDVVLHPDGKIGNGFRALIVSIKTVLVNVVRKVDLQASFVLGRDTSRGNAIAWCRNTLACGRIDVTCGDTLTGMARKEE